MNSKEAFIPLAAALAVGAAAAASQRCSEYEYVYPDAGDAAVVDAGVDTQTPDAGGTDADSNGSTDNTGGGRGNSGGYDDPGVIAGEDASLPPPTPVTPPGLVEVLCENGELPQGTEVPKWVNFFANNPFGAWGMHLGDKNGNGAKKALSEPNATVGGHGLTMEMGTLSETISKEAGGGVLLFVTPSPESIGLTGEKQEELGEIARWTRSLEKGNPANNAFWWPTTLFVQADTSKAPNNEEGVRTMMTELAAAIRKQDKNLMGSVLSKYGLMELDTTSGLDNDMIKATLGKGKNVITFIAVPACKGSIDTSRAETRRGLHEIFARQEQYAKRQPIARKPVADYRTRSRRA